MARTIDSKIKELADKLSENNESPLKLFKRFLDDIFIIFTGSTKKLHMLLKEINTIHPNIQLTMNHTTLSDEPIEDKCECQEQTSIPFLDTSCTLKNGQIITDLYRKPSDRNQYLLTSSCHPIQCTENIPYSLAMRINRICSEIESREVRFAELKQLLLDREYRPGMIDAAIDRARAIPRAKALKYVVQKQSNKRPVFVVTYGPRLPNVTAIQQKHWRSMVNMDPYLLDVYPEPPLTAYRRQKNIRDYIIRSYLNRCE